MLCVCLARQCPCSVGRAADCVVIDARCAAGVHEQACAVALLPVLAPVELPQVAVAVLVGYDVIISVNLYNTGRERVVFALRFNDGVACEIRNSGGHNDAHKDYYCAKDYFSLVLFKHF